MNQLENYLHALFTSQSSLVESVLDWHTQNKFQYLEQAIYVCEELKSHPLLWESKKALLLTNVEFLMASAIRKLSKDVPPKDWQPDQDLETLWLQPTEGHLAKIWHNSNLPEDALNLLKFQNSPSFRYRGLDKTQEERFIVRLQKLQDTITKKRVIIFLGRQTTIYKNLIKALNAQEELQYASDHSWSSLGFTEPGMKTSDNRLSVIQACETVKRLPALFPNEPVAQESKIMFTLDGYDVFHVLSAIYSDCNKIARSHTQPHLPPLTHFDFAYTGLTDLELANIVRNKAWFEVTCFCRTSETGKPEMLSAAEVAGEYGIICLDK